MYAQSLKTKTSQKNNRTNLCALFLFFLKRKKRNKFNAWKGHKVDNEKWTMRTSLFYFRFKVYFPIQTRKNWLFFSSVLFNNILSCLSCDMSTYYSFFWRPYQPSDLKYKQTNLWTEPFTPLFSIEVHCLSYHKWNYKSSCYNLKTRVLMKISKINSLQNLYVIFCLIKPCDSNVLNIHIDFSICTFIIQTKNRILFWLFVNCVLFSTLTGHILYWWFHIFLINFFSFFNL